MYPESIELVGTDAPVEVGVIAEEVLMADAAVDLPAIEVDASDEDEILLVSGFEDVPEPEVGLSDEDVLAEIPLMIEVQEEAAPSPIRTMKPRHEAFVDGVAYERAVMLVGEELVTEITADMATAAKKVSEKVYNAMCAIGERSRLSNYTELTIKALIESGSLTTSQLASVMVASGYSDATARSQTCQQFATLRILRIASGDGSAMTLNSDSAVLAQLQRLYVSLRADDLPDVDLADEMDFADEMAHDAMLDEEADLLAEATAIIED